MTGDITPETTQLTIPDGAQPLPNGADVPAPEQDIDAEYGAVWDKHNVQNGAARGENGKFTSPASAEGQQDGEASPEGEKGAEGAESPSPVNGAAAPAHILGPIKARWESFTQEEREAILAHQSEQDRKFGQLGDQLRTIKPIADRLTEATSKFPDFAGMTPDQLAQGAIELAAVQVNLGKNPVGTIMEIAKHYKVLPQLAQAFAGQQGERQGDQGQLITGLQQKISNLEAQLRKASDPDTIRETVSKTFLERETETLVQNFAASDGKEYWADVEAMIPGNIKFVMENGLAQEPKAILKAAYDMAINAHPEVRVKVRAAEAKATETKPDPKRTEAAKKAASINVPSTQTGKEREMSEDELLATAYDRKMAN